MNQAALDFQEPQWDNNQVLWPHFSKAQLKLVPGHQPPSLAASAGACLLLCGFSTSYLHSSVHIYSPSSLPPSTKDLPPHGSSPPAEGAFPLQFYQHLPGYQQQGLRLDWVGHVNQHSLESLRCLPDRGPASGLLLITLR